jgi:pilus assembly protein CpaC
LNLQPTPSLDTREAVSTLELSDGQTMSIAGLISENQSNNQEQTPGLADIPVLGSLFRNRQSLSDKKELVILVTPHLARPIAPDQIHLPTDNYVAPDDIDFYLLGRMEARKNPVTTAQAPVYDPLSGGTSGQFGHQITNGE